MERIKAAWDSPEIVEGEYEVLEDGPAKLEAGQVEAGGTHNRHYANQSEAMPAKDSQSPQDQLQNYNDGEHLVPDYTETPEAIGFHLPPLDLAPDTDPGAEDYDQDEQNPDTDQAPHDIAGQDAQPASHAGRGDNQQ